VLLAPARSDDPCPMTVIEALADGLPVLGSDRGGLPELVGEDAGLPVEDPAAWSAALTALWTDPAARAAAGAAALARARTRHSPDAWYAGLMAVYSAA
jgi:glycosyltransferase involved in cell wall biosynthesis